jgi:hypothetical protein
MKLIITEHQYEKLFNNKKRKLIVTESQYSKILSEDNVTKALNNIKDGQAIKLTDAKGSEMYFKVLGVLDNAITVINCNPGSVYVNTFFRIHRNDIQNGDVGYTSKNRKYIKIDVLDKETGGKYKTLDDIEKANKAKKLDDAEFKRLFELFNKEILKINPGFIAKDISKNKDTWKSSTFKNVKLSVFDDSGSGLKCKLSPSSEPKFTIDTGSKKAKDSFDGGAEGKENDKQLIIKNLLSFKRDSGIVFNLKGGSKLFGIVLDKKDKKSISIEVMNFEGSVGKGFEIGNLIKFESDPKNVNVRGEGEDELFDLRFKAYVGDYDRKTKDTKTKDVYLKNIMEIDIANVEDKDGDIKVTDMIEKEIGELTDEEMDELIKSITSGNKNVVNAMWKKPNWFSELLLLSKERGIIPAESKLGEKIQGALSEFSQFKENSIGTVRFSSLRLDDNKLQEALSEIKNREDKSKNYNKPGNPTKNVAFKTIAKINNRGDNTPMVETNFKDKIGKEEKLYFRLYLVKKIKETDKVSQYECEVYYKTKEKSDNIKLGDAVLDVVRRDEKKDKDKKKENK